AVDTSGQLIPLLAGAEPSSLAVSDVNGDGKADLQVGNEFGDVLTLLGDGDGTFRPAQAAAGRNVALAVADLNGDVRDDFGFGDESLDRVSVRYSAPGSGFVRGLGDGILAPGAVRLADLNNDGLPDLVVVNSGGNSVLVYLGTGAGQFGPKQTFFSGTDPQGVSVGDVNGDGIPDLVVANRGSDDVS